MYFFSTIAFAALPFLVGAVSVQSSSRDVISIPISKRSKVHKAVTVESLEANIHQTTSKLQSGFKVYKKNTGKTHKLAAKQVQSDKRDVNIIPLTDDGVLWTGEIEIGTPPKKFIVQIGTGSSDLIVPGLSCPSCNGRQAYNPDHSSTAHGLKESFTIPITDGTVVGDQYKDNVNFGGFEAKNQVLGAASQYGPYYSSNSFLADGVLGMAFKEISALNATPVFTTLVNEGLLTKPIFGLVLAEPSPKLILGGRDTNLYNGDLTFVTVETPGFWQTNLDGVTINGSDLQISYRAVIIDSGSELIFGSHEDIVKVYDYISNSTEIDSTGYWKLPCDAKVDIQINFGGVDYSIPPASFIRGPIVYNGSKICYGGFAETNLNQEFWIIGDLFLENVYTEFDAVNLQVGFAQLAN